VNRILAKEQLSELVFRMELEAPAIARARRAGQFVILQPEEDFGERIPLTIADANAERGTIAIVFQVVGATTRKLARLEPGDAIANLVGPLGRPTAIEPVRHVVCVGGGIGAAPLHPIARAFKDAGSRVTVIIGARTKSLVVMEKEMRSFADEVVIVTDDGSYGEKALVTAPLKAACEATPPPDLAIVIGPPVMMKFCAATTKPYGIRTLASLNTIMIDGTGMCGGCRVSVGGETKFVCVDGPEFDAHQIDFDAMIRRLGAFKREERIADEKCTFHAEAVAKGLKA